jgi:hypothetical protein
MPRQVEGKSQIATQIDADLHEALRELSDESGISISRLVEDGIRRVLHGHGRDDRSGWLDRYYLAQEEREAEIEARRSLDPAQAVAVAAFADGVPADRQCTKCGTALSKLARQCLTCGTVNPNYKGAK